MNDPIHAQPQVRPVETTSPSWTPFQPVDEPTGCLCGYGNYEDPVDPAWAACGCGLGFVHRR